MSFYDFNQEIQLNNMRRKKSSKVRKYIILALTLILIILILIGFYFIFCNLKKSSEANLNQTNETYNVTNVTSTSEENVSKEYPSEIVKIRKPGRIEIVS